MRAGKLDRVIDIESFSSSTSADGSPVELWSLVERVRAQLLQMSTDEYLRAYGETEARAVIFRTRWLDGLTTAHRVVYDGRALNIREIKEIGRRAGLELRCEEVRA